MLGENYYLDDFEWELATEEDEWEGFCRTCGEREESCFCCDICRAREEECICEKEGGCGLDCDCWHGGDCASECMIVTPTHARETPMARHAK